MCAGGTEIFRRCLQEQKSWWVPFPSFALQPRYMDISGNQGRYSLPSLVTPCPVPTCGPAPSNLPHLAGALPKWCLAYLIL